MLPQWRSKIDLSLVLISWLMVLPNSISASPPSWVWRAGRWRWQWRASRPRDAPRPKLHVAPMYVADVIMYLTSIDWSIDHCIRIYLVATLYPGLFESVHACLHNAYTCRVPHLWTTHENAFKNYLYYQMLSFEVCTWWRPHSTLISKQPAGKKNWLITVPICRCSVSVLVGSVWFAGALQARSL